MCAEREGGERTERGEREGQRERERERIVLEYLVLYWSGSMIDEDTADIMRHRDCTRCF